MLRIENLTKQYLYGATAVSALSLEVNEGEHVAILGGRESGKTSLLKAIAGLYPVTEGRIFNNDIDITDEPIKRRNLQLVQDDGGIFRRHTVLYNLEYPLKVRKLAKTERRKSIKEVAEKFGLDAFLKEYCFRLYESETVKLALARTALRTSPLVMIDDIFSLLPSSERKDVFEELSPRIEEIESTLLFATSSVEEAFSIGNRVVFMSYGNAVQIDSPEVFKNNPVALCVDKYVNRYRNFIEVPVEKRDGQRTIVFGGMRYLLPEDSDDEYVVISYELEKNDAGERFLASSKLYADGKYYLLNDSGIKYCSDSLEPTSLMPCRESLRIYSLSTEKRLTFTTI